MSFMLTTKQFKERTKTVTRRCGWWHLKPGDVVMGVEKGQGLKKGEKVVKLGPIRIKSTRHEQVYSIVGYPPDETRLEGFPGMPLGSFVRMFCEHNGCEHNEPVNRIEFEYLE